MGEIMRLPDTELEIMKAIWEGEKPFPPVR